jgi:exo-beta-1,3-glucanase (GH17 family)
MKTIPYGKAICYSGYRHNQGPNIGVFPTYDQVKEDLKILEKDWDYIRMYDPGEHAKTVCQVIKDHNIDLKVMVGINLLGEISNPQCAWGGLYTKAEIKRNIQHNEYQLLELIKLANQYPNVINAVSAGNESVPEWNDNLVSPSRVLYFVQELKKNVTQAVTYCDNVNYWDNILTDVANEVDFLSIHIYPVWLGHTVHEARQISLQDYYRIANHYPNKQCIITEAGWPTNSNNQTIHQHNVGEKEQLIYYENMRKWADETETIIYFFEAFDEPWKGSNDPLEPEKHWGFYQVERKPKLVCQNKRA